MHTYVAMHYFNYINYWTFWGLFSKYSTSISCRWVGRLFRCL